MISSKLIAVVTPILLMESMAAITLSSMALIVGCCCRGGGKASCCCPQPCCVTSWFHTMGHIAVGRCTSCMLDQPGLTDLPCHSCRWLPGRVWRRDLSGHTCSVCLSFLFLFLRCMLMASFASVAMMLLWLDFLVRWGRTVVFLFL